MRSTWRHSTDRDTCVCGVRVVSTVVGLEAATEAAEAAACDTLLNQPVSSAEPACVLSPPNPQPIHSTHPITDPSARCARAAPSRRQDPLCAHTLEDGCAAPALPAGEWLQVLLGCWLHIRGSTAAAPQVDCTSPCTHDNKTNPPTRMMMRAGARA